MAFQVTLSHMIVFFLVFAVGFAASRLKVIKEDALPAFAQIITKLLLPCMIFYSTYANCKRETIIGNWEMVLLAALFYAVISLLMFVIAKLMCIEHDKDRVFQLCFIFGNTGFVGVPLLAAVFPDANGARACHHHGATRHDSGAHGGCQQRQGVRICDRHYCCNARGEHRNHSARCVSGGVVGQARSFRIMTKRGDEDPVR